MKYAILITGSGGQGVLSSGMSIASSVAGLAHSTYVPWYGAAQRGGVARCSVVVSDEPILSPLPGLYNAIVAMNDSACQKALSELRHGGLIVRNSNRCTSRISADAILLDVPADDMAKEAGDRRMANMVLTGALLGMVGVIPLEDVEELMLSKMAAKNPALGEMNRKALEAGYAWGEDPDHIVELEEKEVTDSKYSLERTTVGELLDTPELRAVVERIVPQILEHPLIEAGRMFRIADALPYIKDMITDEQLNEFRTALESL